MLVAKQHWPINWVDGMKLSREHFQGTDLYTEDLVRDSVSLFLTNYNFGLLPPVKGSTSSNEIELLERISNYLEVKLSRCNAITPGGCRIAINPEILRFTTLTARLEIEDAFATKLRHMYDVILMVDPFNRLPIGEPDPDETPLRHPYTSYQYELKVVPSEQTNAGELGSHHLLIGKVVYQDGRYQVDEHFIPPCASITSHPALVSYYKEFGWGLNELQVSSFKIVRKIFERNQPSDIARNTKYLCDKILDYVGTVFFQYRNLDHQHPPVTLLRYFADLTSVIYTLLYCIPTREKEEMLHYFYEWTDVTPGQFEESMRDIFEMDYDHYAIQHSMMKVQKFLTVFVELWNKLSTLEYIGQRKDNIVVRHEETLRATPITKGWNILD